MGGALRDITPVGPGEGMGIAGSALRSQRGLPLLGSTLGGKKPSLGKNLAGTRAVEGG